MSKKKQQPQEQQQGGLPPDFTDPTPNENYTIGGVISGAPTPETDPEAEKAARERLGLDPTQSKFVPPPAEEEK